MARWRKDPRGASAVVNSIKLKSDLLIRFYDKGKETHNLTLQKAKRVIWIHFNLHQKKQKRSCVVKWWRSSTSLTQILQQIRSLMPYRLAVLWCDRSQDRLRTLCRTNGCTVLVRVLTFVNGPWVCKTRMIKEKRMNQKKDVDRFRGVVYLEDRSMMDDNK